MEKYEMLSKEELKSIKAALEEEYAKAQHLGLKLDMSRGKPAPAQLDLAMGILDAVSSTSDYKSEDGVDCRNYGVLDGIPEAKLFMADIMGVDASNVIIYGNASLNIMYDTISRFMLEGTGGCTPWCKLDKVKFLCPVPGYDRHFAITQHFGVEMINIPMKEDGPDMDMVEKLVSEDESIKGIWCVPKFSNPGGCVYSDEVVRRMAALKPAAKDFRIMWDNAYVVHYLYEDNQPHILDILTECEKAGNPDMVYEFASTSKISFAGAGIAALATSKANIAEVKKSLTIQTIGYDKLNQLRHIRFYKNKQGIMEHMMKQAEILRPKFEAVEEIFDNELSGLGIGTWTKPKGGYFIAFDSLDGCAKAIVARCKKAGLVMTGAGATYPYGKDPHDTNIRIAPSYPPLGDLILAMDLFALCTKIVSIDKILKDRADAQEAPEQA